MSLRNLFSPLTSSSSGKQETAPAATDEEDTTLASSGTAETKPLNNQSKNVSFGAADPLPITPLKANGNSGYGSTLIPPANRTNSLEGMESFSNLPSLYPNDGPGFFPEMDNDMIGSPDVDGEEDDGGQHDHLSHLSLNRAHSLLRMQHLSKDSPNMGRRPTLRKTQSSFWEDAVNFTEGTIPQSIIIAICVGTVCGIAAFIYHTILFYLLETIWHTIPEAVVVDKWAENLYVLWIPIVGFSMAILTGLTVVFLGEPGDLACKYLFCCFDCLYTIICVMTLCLSCGGLRLCVYNNSVANAHAIFSSRLISSINTRYNQVRP